MADKSVLNMSFKELKGALEEVGSLDSLKYARFEFAQLKNVIPSDMGYYEAAYGKFKDLLENTQQANGKGAFINQFEGQDAALESQYLTILQFHVLQAQYFAGKDISGDAKTFCKTRNVDVNGDGRLNGKDGQELEWIFNSRRTEPMKGLDPILKPALVKMKGASLEENNPGAIKLAEGAVDLKDPNFLSPEKFPDAVAAKLARADSVPEPIAQQYIPQPVIAC